MSDLKEFVAKSHAEPLNNNTEDSRDLMLQSVNYSWNARNGMKVILDTQIKEDLQIIPTPSMYSKKPFTCIAKEITVVSAFETVNDDEFYRKQFRKHIVPNKKCTGLAEPKDELIINSTGECNGDIKTEEIKREALEDKEVVVRKERLIDRRTVESAKDLEILEAKLRLSRKRRYAFKCVPFIDLKC